MPTTPTLLVFTRGPALEAQRKRLLPHRLVTHETAVHGHGLTAALAAGAGAGCQLAVASPVRLCLPAGVTLAPQGDGDFGRRFVAALVALEAGQPGPRLVVGTDVPGLTSDHLASALSLLAADPRRAVLGPSPDGGVYLIASRRPLASLLAGVRWCSRHTASDLARRLTAAGFEVCWLAPLADLDRAADLVRWLAQPAGAGWAAVQHRLRQVFAEQLRPGAARRAVPARTGFTRLAAGRAPPVAA